MTTHNAHPIYPAYTFRSSPTYGAWVKLTAADVHTLRDEPAFAGQNTLFHLNHPIKFARLVGVVIAINIPNLKFALLTLDDGSGATIDIKISRLEKAIADSADCPSNTEVDNVNVVHEIGELEVLVDGQVVDIGTVLSVKGTFSTWWGIRQIELKRVRVIKDTNEEVQAWADRSTFRKDVLDKPWVLSKEGLRKLDKDVRREEKRSREKAKKRAEYEAGHQERKVKRIGVRKEYDEKIERRRRKEETMFNAGALKGTDWIPL
ncbi:hypothetical protein LTS18_007010 [Coniosporium uncinatum]|uniref:Uncharacterized protein n=1 Tax=Coniosporium uncinatum TaxID=93489 RepID=A0ACC3DPV0_9PEZI|nr:hypothetical protein LTS18_007010 [Coniosporium uncinatum]